MDMLEIGLKWLPVVVSVILVPAVRSAVKAGLVTKDDFRDWSDRHDSEHAELDRRLADGDRRFVRVETLMEHLPTQDDIRRLTASNTDLALKVERLHGDLGRIDAVMAMVRTDTDTLVHAHMEPRK